MLPGRARRLLFIGEKMTNGIELKNLRKAYDGAGSAWAVDGVDLTIGTGQFITLLGASGCGKTTTLRMIAGLEIPPRARSCVTESTSLTSR